MVLMKKENFYLLGCKGDGCETSHYRHSSATVRKWAEDAEDSEWRETYEELSAALALDEPYDGTRYTDIDSLPWRCKNCHSPLDGVQQIDIKIDETEKYLAKQRPLTFADCLLVDLIWEPFIRTVPAHILERDMQFGNVLRPDGTRIEGWLTCNYRYSLYLRATDYTGTNTLRITVCKDCGYVRWSSPGKWFLYPAPPEDADIFQCGHGTLFRESIFQYLDMEQWRKKVYVTKIKVADKPLDGLDLPQFRIPRDLKWVVEHPEIERR